MQEIIQNIPINDLEYIQKALQAMGTSRSLPTPRSIQVTDEAGMWLSGKTCLLDLPSDSVSCASTIILSLSHLKAPRTSLSQLALSLDNSISHISEQHSPLLREVGMASLPDEIIARIFELTFHLCPYGNRRQLPAILASVSTRFRRIALSLPGLWRIVSCVYGEQQNRLHTSRCPNPIVDVIHLSSDHRRLPISDFLPSLHPTSQWHELHFVFSDILQRILIKEFCRLAGPSFDSLKSLTISSCSMSDRSPSAEFPNHTVPEVAQLLSSWSLPSLTTLHLNNIVPTSFYCPSLQTCRLTLQSFPGSRPSQWDLSSLRTFLNCLRSISSFSVILLDMTAPRELPTASVNFPNLKVFDLEVHGRCSPNALSAVMTMLDMPMVTKMDLLLHPERAGQMFVQEWVRELFVCRTDREESYRTYSHLEDFSLSITPSPQTGTPLDYLPLFKGIPGVQNLSMSLPGFSDVEWGTVQDKNSCLRNLRTMHLKDCTYFFTNFGHDSFEFKVNDGFQKLHIERSRSSLSVRKELEYRLGDRLLWTE